ncbi:MAG: xylulokinase [Planctomycetaceae bacterium]|nr:xylulokinase [Planctomycetaceae bacterium]
MPHLLGIDIGTSGTKALICTNRGKVLATATADHDIASPKPGWSEQDPRQWWTATCKATKQALKKAKVKPATIKGIGLSGQMHGSVFLADDGPESAQPLRPALLWNDQRTVAECADLEKAAGGRRKLIEMTGNPALTGFTAPKILWVRKREPRIFEKTRHILLPKDYIRFRMTGEYATEVGDASGTSLLDPKMRAWNKTLIRKLDLDPALLPRCYESHEVSGQLTTRAADALGLKAGTPVVGGSGDQPAGAVGNGIVTTGIVSATMGTSGVVFAHADRPIYDPRGRVHTMCSAVAGKWCVFGCMLSAGGSFQWFRNQLGQTEVAAAKRKRVDPYELLIAQAESEPPGSEGLMFLPYLTGERCPYPDPDARGAWIGLTARSTRSAMIRAILEGVTCGMNDAVQIIRGMKIPVNTIRLSGGGARSAFWRQLQTDIYNTPTAVINTEEGPAFGVAILAGVGTGVWKDVPEAANAVIREVTHHQPNPDTARFYQKVYRQYRRLYPALRDQFPRLAKLNP